jgi:hypothetical protein
VDIRLFIEHYGGGSWHQGDLQRQSAWLKQHLALWEGEGNGNKIASQKTKPADAEKLSKPKTAKRTTNKGK